MCELNAVMGNHLNIYIFVQSLSNFMQYNWEFNGKSYSKFSLQHCKVELEWGMMFTFIIKAFDICSYLEPFTKHV